MYTQNALCIRFPDVRTSHDLVKRSPLIQGVMTNDDIFVMFEGN